MKIEFTEVTCGADQRVDERFTGMGGRVTFQSDDGRKFAGVVVNESFGGAGVIFDEPIPITISDEVEVTYHGVPTMAIVRHMTAFNKGGCMVGVHWKAAAIEAQMEELRELCQRRDLDLPDNLLRFIDLLPGGVQLMMQLAEKERWAELTEAIDRLSKDALAANINGTDDCLTVMMQLLGDAPEKAAVAKELDKLITQYVQKTTDAALSHKTFE